MVCFCAGLVGCDDFDSSGAGGSGTQTGTTSTTMSGSMTTATMMQSSSSTGPMPTCIPSDPAWTPSDECGVFVAVGGMGVGTRAEPMGSVVDAVAAAAAIGKPVYVSDGTYTGAVTLASGQILYGGLTAQWAFDGALRPVITAAADQIPMRLIAGAGETGVHHVKVQAENAEAVGGSSIAMLIEDTPSVIESVDLVAGNGQNGMSSTTPNDPIGPTMATDAGIIGNAGTNAMAGSTPAIAGGPEKMNATCATGVGGKGGDGGTVSGSTANVAAPGNPGQVLPGGCAGNCGQLGMGEVTAGDGCSDGTRGANGSNGDNGVAAAVHGALDTTGYVAPAPGDGTSGTPGQGGGGGGGAMGKGTPASLGASGGSGGAGGCGGHGALGGTGGGSSIALLVLGATPSLSNSTLTAGGGGDGGDGAEGQGGATGGNGGGGGEPGMVTLVGSACNGGNGGRGGNGGAGAGGRGGHAIGIAFNGTAPTDGFTVVSKGAGGAGGMSPVNAGVMGESQDILDFVP